MLDNLFLAKIQSTLIFSYVDIRILLQIDKMVNYHENVEIMNGWQRKLCTINYILHIKKIETNNGEVCCGIH